MGKWPIATRPFRFWTFCCGKILNFEGRGGRRGWGNYASKLTTQSGKLTVGRFSPMKSRDRYENYIRLLKRAGTGCIGSIRFPATFLPLLVEWCWKVAVFFFFFFSFRLDLFSVVGCCCRPSGDFSSFVMRLHDYPSSRTWKQDHYSLKKTHLRDQNN